MSSKKLEQNELYIVGVGTSAGGVDALTKMLSGFTGQSINMCVIIAQHLARDHKSELTEILSRTCNWPVKTVKDQTIAEPHTIYVTPENKAVTYKGRKIQLHELSSADVYSPNIDNFFASIAEEKKQYAIGVLLSGTAQDGAIGITKIKQNGGLTIVQSPESAKFADMPVAAIKTEQIDVVIHPSLMYAEVLHYLKNHRAIKEVIPVKNNISSILEMLAKRSGTDFSRYKQATIERRIKKRLEALKLGTIEAYYDMLQDRPTELDQLFNTVLIGVTEFFRDEKSFDLLKTYIEGILSLKNHDDKIRVWSVGCATGEEAYSIAMIFHEILGDNIYNYQLQIFASDIDNKALNFARKGVYSESSVSKLSPQFIEKYFDRQDKFYAVKKQVKQHVLFSRHDISNDPPFVKLDLIVCRNMLIYFNSSLQKEVLQIFNYSLNKNGILFLGKSENVSVAGNIFVKEKSDKFFRKNDSNPHSRRLGINRFRMRNEHATPKNITLTEEFTLLDTAKDALFEADNKAFVIIDESGNIKEIKGSVRLFVEMKPGQLNTNIYNMVNPELVIAVRSLVSQAAKSKTPVKSQAIKFNVIDNDYFVNLELIPFTYSVTGANFYIIKFLLIEPDTPYLKLVDKYTQTDFENLRISELEEEISSLKEHLKTFTDALETSNEELQVVNEELQSTNEEAKSSNEELETSNEELQSTNEELHTANIELKFANEQLIEKEFELKKTTAISLQNELLYRTLSENIPNGTIGLLNSDLVIEYLAGEKLEFWNVNPTKILGTSLKKLSLFQENQEILDRVFKETLEGIPGLLNIDFNDRHFILRTIPVLLPGNLNTKILYLTQDVTETVKRENKLLESEFKFRSMAKYIPVLCWTAHANGSIYWYNDRWYEYTGTAPEDMEGWGWQAVHDPMKLPEVMIKWQESIRAGTEFDMVFPLRGKDGVFRPFLTRIIPLKDNDGNVMQWFGTNTDITTQKIESEKLEKLVTERTEDLISLNTKLEERNSELSETRNFLETLLNSSIEYISVVDQDLRYINVNKEFCLLMEMSTEEIIGKNIFEISPQLENSAQHQSILKALQGEHVHLSNHAFYKNPSLYVDSYFVPLIIKNAVKGVIIMKRDVSHIIKAEKVLESKNKELNRSNEDLQQFAHVASHDLKEPVRKIKIYTGLLQKELRDTILPRQIHQLSRIASAADRMYDMINGVLTYSSVETTHVYNEQVNLNEIIEAIEEDLDVIIESKNAVIEITCNLPTIEGGTVLLHQVFFNLIKNALKFSSPDTQPIIKISGNNIIINNQSFAEIIVSDNGIGFSSENAELIFGTFTRLHSKDQYEGTGLGLALCKKIIERHGGTITAKGVPDEGAKFIIRLPYTQLTTD